MFCYKHHFNVIVLLTTNAFMTSTSRNYIANVFLVKQLKIIKMYIRCLFGNDFKTPASCIAFFTRLPDLQTKTRSHIFTCKNVAKYLCITVLYINQSNIER